MYNGRIVRVANSFVFTDPGYNYSGDFPFLWDEFTLPIKYGGDHRLARQILETAVSEIVGEYILAAESHWAKILLFGFAVGVCGMVPYGAGLAIFK